MFLKQIYTDCLAQASYYVESDGEAIVIDPLRDVDVYLEIANKNSAKIKYIFETHFHADFVSGHLTLAETTGSKIIYGPKADPNFDAIIALDNQIFKFGKIFIKVIHTPGHTLESSSYLLFDEEGKPNSIFTGDTLFIGDVGIPDVAQRYKGLSKKDLASILYNSINNKIKPLPDDIIVYPGHGAGSACGKNMMKKTFDTLGNQKKINYSLNDTISKKYFIKALIEDLPKPPSYFPYNVKMNQDGYENLSNVIKRARNPLSLTDFEIKMKIKDVKILDVRSSEQFCRGHIPGSIFIGINGGFAPWVGAIMADPGVQILLVVDETRLNEAIIRLSRVGFDKVIGYLNGGFNSWIPKNKFNTVPSVFPNKSFISQIKDDIVLDVRNPSEIIVGKIKNSLNIPLNELNSKLHKISKSESYSIYCAGGYRSVIAASILMSKGFKNVKNIYGGFKSIAAIN